MSNHKKLSYIKSGLRIFGCLIGSILSQDTAVETAFIFLMLAEWIGIWEEEFE